MATVDSKSPPKTGISKQMSQEQIVSGFNELRGQQRAIAGKISELEMERKEHDLVITALKDVDGDRKCFRMVGGVLVERTVSVVLPALQNNYEQLGKVLETLTQQLEVKGRDLNAYREKYNIRVRGEDDGGPATPSQEPSSKQSSGVLVAKDST